MSAEAADRAWVAIPLDIAPDQVLNFCSDIERLFRINSGYEVLEWRDEGSGRHVMRLRNLIGDRYWATSVGIERVPDGFRAVYAEGLKASTEFGVSTASDGRTILTITDDYTALPEAEKRARIDEVDRSLTTWGRDIQRYLANWMKWSRVAPYRWYMRRVWLPMKPAGRRIAYILIVIGVFEAVAGLLALIAFAFGWW